MSDRILWRRLDIPGHEIAEVTPVENGWRLTGTSVFAHDERPCRLDYIVTCNDAWWTTAASVTGVVGDLQIDLRVAVDAKRRWRVNEAECRAVEGCIDIDLEFTPSTNLLPIRRLGLAVGEDATVRSAWLSFPSLTFELVPQVYRRERERTYRFESSGGAFVRLLEVNAAGFVTSYPGLWQAESATS
jgi:uncharacterized protein